VVHKKQSELADEVAGELLTIIDGIKE